MIFPTNVVVRNVSGLLLKKFINLANTLLFLEMTSSLSLFAETKAISEPEKKPLNRTDNTMSSHSMINDYLFFCLNINYSMEARRSSNKNWFLFA